MKTKEKREQKIQAIETYYKNTRFRSRLEAKWALFFDELGIVWDYEPQGFEAKGIKYLPDFFFPELDYFFEIKPYAPSMEDIIKSSICPFVSGTTILLAWGYPQVPHVEWSFEMVDIYSEYLASIENDGRLPIEDLKIPSKSDRFGCTAICQEASIALLEGGSRLPIWNRQFKVGCLMTAELRRCPACKKFYFDGVENRRGNYDNSVICPFNCEINDAHDHLEATALKVRNHRFGKIA